MWLVLPVALAALSWAGLRFGLPPLVQWAIEKHGSEALAAELARWPGPIVTLTALLPGDAQVPLQRLITERSISTNTAAAGGNASLMML